MHISNIIWRNIAWGIVHLVAFDSVAVAVAVVDVVDVVDVVVEVAYHFHSQDGSY